MRIYNSYWEKVKTGIVLMSYFSVGTILIGCGNAEQADTSQAQIESVDVAEEAVDAIIDETVAETTEADSGEMTDSYKEGRQAFYDACGIWMPEAEGFEAEWEATEQSVCFDSHGDKALYEGAKAAISEVFGDPSEETDNSADWHIEQAGITENYNIYYDDSNLDDVWVYMNYYVTE